MRCWLVAQNRGKRFGLIWHCCGGQNIIWTGQGKLLGGFIIGYISFFFSSRAAACQGTVSSVQPGSAAGLERSQQFPLCSDAGRAAPFHTNITC